MVRPPGGAVDLEENRREGEEKGGKERGAGWETEFEELIERQAGEEGMVGGG